MMYFKCTYSDPEKETFNYLCVISAVLIRALSNYCTEQGENLLETDSILL